MGYNRDDLYKMIYYFPKIFSYSINNIRKKVDYIISFGYSFSDVIKMTRIEPSIFGHSVSDFAK